MTGVNYGLADFRTGGRILDLPVMEGASWSAMLNRADAVGCSISLNDPDAVRLDLRSSTEPNKTVMFAETETGHILAWGLIGDDGREWDEDEQTLTLTAVGIKDSYFAQRIIGPASALSATLITNDAEGFPEVNPALNTTLSGWSHGTIGKKLVEQALAWPGSPTVFDLPADEVGTREEEYLFASLKSVGKALDDLTAQEVGPDFAFEAQRAADGISLRYSLRHGSEATPRIGTDLGSWHLGPGSPIIGLKSKDVEAAGASAGWMTAGKQSGAVLLSRRLNAAMLDAGYPALDLVDTTHNDVTKLGTLNSHNAANMRDAAKTLRDLHFSVRAVDGLDNTQLGTFRPGDTVTIDAPDGHKWFTKDMRIRITSISGDETGHDVKIGCVVIS